MFFRENFKKEELPAASFSMHKIRELPRLCGSAQQCSGLRISRRGHWCESLPRVCVSGTGMLNRSSFCLQAKFFPKTPALSLICELPKPGEGEKAFYCTASECRGREPPDWSWACSPLSVPGAGGSCSVRPQRQQDVIHFLPSLFPCLRAAPGSPRLPGPPPGASPGCAAVCESPSDIEPRRKEPVPSGKSPFASCQTSFLSLVAAASPLTGSRSQQMLLLQARLVGGLVLH